MNTYNIYCAGRFIKTNQQLIVTDKYSNEPVFDTYLAGIVELEEAIKAGLSAKEIMKAMPVYKRYDILTTIAAKLSERKDEAARILAAEAGKPLKHALAEVGRAVQTFKVAAEECKRIPGHYMSIDWTPEAAGKEAVVRHFPVGLVAGIAPFNFPLNLAVHKIAPAIAAGCPIILKPASNTPISTLFLSQIIHESGLPAGALSVLPMDRATGNNLVTDERISLLSFTGSPDVGWEMKQNAGKKKVVLELGGNAGVIVSDSANPVFAAQRALTGGFAYAGQICIHAQRFFVHESLYQAFIDALVPLVNDLKVGDTADINTDFSVMIDENNAIRAEAWVNEAIASGATLLHGGRRQWNLMEPTILTDTHRDMKVNACEVFAPIITITSFSDFKEAVAELNYGRFGLQAGVFTNNIQEMDYAFEHIECGGVIINDIPTFRVDHMPYGGVKDSGLGREGVAWAIMDMMEPRILVKPKL